MSAQAPERGRERIARRLARAGLCSRREAERWIAEGRVRVNDVLLASPAVNVGPGDRVEVDGEPVAAPERPRLWRTHKRRGLVTSHRDEHGRPTVFDRLPPELPRVVSVGRLDLDSEGLLLLTNDGDLARHLEHPASGLLRRYRVRAFGTVDERAFARLAAGAVVGGVRYGPLGVRIDRRGDRDGRPGNCWFTVSLREGRNREVRRLFAELGLEVNRLIRVAYGPFQLGALAPGAVEEVPRKVLREQLGREWAARLKAG
jgi:23S rRNA pseudouridine2605 synthase